MLNNLVVWSEIAVNPVFLSPAGRSFTLRIMYVHCAIVHICEYMRYNVYICIMHACIAILDLLVYGRFSIRFACGACIYAIIQRTDIQHKSASQYPVHIHAYIHGCIYIQNTVCEILRLYIIKHIILNVKFIIMFRINLTFE